MTPNLMVTGTNSSHNAYSLWRGSSLPEVKWVLCGWSLKSRCWRIVYQKLTRVNVWQFVSEFDQQERNVPKWNAIKRVKKKKVMHFIFGISDGAVVLHSHMNHMFASSSD